jgi:hypothetical protein
MQDWSSDDYTRVYGDTYYVPEQAASVYLLDEAGLASDHRGDPHLRVPISRYEYTSAGKHRPYGTDKREGFYGNVVSERGDGQLARVYNAAWDERPMHYNPNAGTDWAHLVPSRYDRPYYGGPAPSLAYPVLSQSEGINRPWASQWPATPSAECGGRAVPWPPAKSKEQFGGAGGVASETSLMQSGASGASPQDTTMFILVVVIVLLAVALVSATSHAGSLERLLKKSFKMARQHVGGAEPDPPKSPAGC